MFTGNKLLKFIDNLRFTKIFLGCKKYLKEWKNLQVDAQFFIFSVSPWIRFGD